MTQTQAALAMFAHLHPLLVHFPVAILMFALALAWRALPRGHAPDALALAWLAGAASAWLACITGWFSAENMGRDAALDIHQWLGFGTAGAATAAWFFRKKTLLSSASRLLCASALGLLALTTMHFGATLTHGEGYFFHAKTAAAEPSEQANFPASDVPTETIAAAAPEILQQLASRGIAAIPVAAGSPYLAVNGRNAPAALPDTTLRLLETLAPQVAWLDLSGTGIGDTALASVGKFLNLRRLQLSGTKITDAGLPFLANLKHLRQLNLAGTTGISADGLAALGGLPALEKIQLFGTGIGAEDWLRLREIFPKTALDTGGYRVPPLATDTIVLHKKE